MTGEYHLYELDEPNLSGFEREIVDEVSRDKPWELVEEFGQLRRLSPSPDEREAAAYIEDRFEKYGVPYERYDREYWLSIPHGASVTVRGDPPETYSGSEDDFEQERPSVKPLAFSGSGTVSGEVVYVELPETDDTQEALESATLDTSTDLDGKIVLIDEMIASKKFFRAVEERGAEALVSIHPHEEEPQITTATPVWGAIPEPDEQDRVPEMMNVSVSRSVGDRLQDRLEGEGSLELEVSADVTRDWFECPLVLGKVPAETDGEEFTLLHGHLDSWYYGVTDNATGNAGMVECARILNQHRDRLERDLWIAFWPAHEGGRYGGSTWFADEFAVELAENCLAHINFDSPGVADATEFNMTFWMPEADGLCRGAIRDVTGKDSREQRPPRAGDYSFNNLGVTGMMCLSSGIPEDVRQERGFYPVGGSGGNSEAWHHTTDTIDKADPDVLKRDIEVHLVILSRLLASKVLPFDYRRTVARHREVVAEYDDDVGDQFDLSPVREELDALNATIEEFYGALEAGEIDPVEANDAMRRLSRRLVPVNFATEGRFRQDPATHRPPYPALEPVRELDDLDGDELRFARTALRRGRNEIVYELRRARDELPIS